MRIAARVIRKPDTACQLVRNILQHRFECHDFITVERNRRHTLAGEMVADRLALGHLFCILKYRQGAGIEKVVVELKAFRQRECLVEEINCEPVIVIGRGVKAAGRRIPEECHPP